MSGLNDFVCEGCGASLGAPHGGPCARVVHCDGNEYARVVVKEECCLERDFAWSREDRPPKEPDVVRVEVCRNCGSLFGTNHKRHCPGHPAQDPSRMGVVASHECKPVEPRPTKAELDRAINTLTGNSAPDFAEVRAWKPSPAQAEFLAKKTKDRSIEVGNRSGKTFAQVNGFLRDVGSPLTIEELVERNKMCDRAGLEQEPGLTTTARYCKACGLILNSGADGTGYVCHGVGCLQSGVETVSGCPIEDAMHERLERALDYAEECREAWDAGGEILGCHRGFISILGDAGSEWPEDPVRTIGTRELGPAPSCPSCGIIADIFEGKLREKNRWINDLVDAGDAMCAWMDAQLDRDSESRLVKAAIASVDNWKDRRNEIFPEGLASDLAPVKLHPIDPPRVHVTFPKVPPVVRPATESGE